MKKITKRLTYANVMSSIAVFLVLGGAAFAAAKLPKNSVGTKQLKKNAVTTQKIKNGAVTGAKVNVSGFPKVPSAASADNANHANSADSANNANHANSADSAGTANNVGGTTIKKFFYSANEGSGRTTVLALGNLTLSASCEGGTPALIATTASTGALIHAGGVFGFSETFYEEDDSFEPGDEVNFIEQEPDSVQGTFTYAESTGSVITGVFESEEDGLEPNRDCVISGHAIG
ncbi:MAG TPA: hypothetical protein VFP17_08670 [Solirubrobacterales bacterium]|nr:hypothetical protein [Solirubrobacterales bacterium]